MTKCTGCTPPDEYCDNCCEEAMNDLYHPKAPWTDYNGDELRLGDAIRHPDGTIALIMHIPGDEDEWRALYPDGTKSRLQLQVGDKGRAVRANSIPWQFIEDRTRVAALKKGDKITNIAAGERGAHGVFKSLSIKGRTNGYGVYNHDWLVVWKPNYSARQIKTSIECIHPGHLGQVARDGEWNRRKEEKPKAAPAPNKNPLNN